MKNNFKKQMKNLAEYSDTPLLSEWIPLVIPILEKIIKENTLEEEEKEILSYALNYFKLHRI